MRLSVERSLARPKSRVLGLRLVLLTLKMMENWKRDVEDYDDAMILVAVAAITGERILRSKQIDTFASLSTALPGANMAKCNVSSIASATGLNRETTRRRVRSLVDSGLLFRLPDRTITFAPGVLQNEETELLVFTQLDAIVKSMNELIRDGIVQLSDR